MNMRKKTVVLAVQTGLKAGGISMQHNRRPIKVRLVVRTGLRAAE
jgi:hypothetical protein